ncbi:AAA family ATPase [Halomicrobium salinisoli]|uniref:AAA family ATPase n=1 Tax=Halomicrobium salinisoli TaxID=2878391 RepID=UPI001CF0724D|nr:MoxR family ATPase [Halomicrobium salinisoli]
MTDPAGLHEAIDEEVSTVLVGSGDVVEHLSIALLTRGHVLLEGVPGVAKTTLANVFARATGLEYTRIQMTPDILPADVTGSAVYREGTGEFELRKGPVFANVVVADEINRATPKAQSALLEAMAERQVSIEGETLALPDPFMVVATQNPIEMEGTFELPEAQRDRFQQKLTVDLPERAAEREIVDRFDDAPSLGPGDVERVVSPSDIQSAREAVTDVHVDDAVREYLLDVVAATRDHPDVVHGASPRASIAFLNTAKARAAIDGRDYVIPDDVKALAEPVLIHRLVLGTDADLSDVTPAAVVGSVLESVTPPGGDPDRSAAPADRAASDGGVADDGA